MLRFPFVFLFSFAALMLVACDKAEEHRKRVAAEYQKRLPEMERSGIVAGPDEPTFEESQGVKLQLPMPEDQFLELLKRLNLPYDLQTIIPTPWHSKKLDVSKMQRAYQIYGKTNRARQVAEMYCAYVDDTGRVVYLENMFGILVALSRRSGFTSRFEVRARCYCRANLNGHHLDPFGGSKLVVSRLLPAALDRYPHGLTGHVAVPNRSILR